MLTRTVSPELPRGLGFLTFHSIDYAKAFLERNHPYIHLYGPTAGENDRATKVRIAYSREREDRSRAKQEGEWTCRLCGVVNYPHRQNCFRCNAPRPESGPTGPPGVPVPKIANNGDNDAAPEGQPSQFLLFRGLDSSVTEELFAKGATKLYKPSSDSNDGASSNPKKASKVASTTGDANLGARQGSIRRVLLVRDRKSNASWRYGFAEFASALDAQAALQRLNSFEKFTIASKPVLVTYIHAGVFVPVMDPPNSDDGFTFSPLNNPSMKLMYWDAEGYVSELKLSSDEDESAPEQSHSENAKTKQRDAQVKRIKDTEKSKKRKADAVANANPKRMAMPSQLQFWKDRHAELHGTPKGSDEKSDSPEDSNEKQPGVVGDRALDSNAPPAQSYADPKRNFCYLCMRQFKDAASVNQHERLSQLHRDNLQNEEAKARAMTKLNKYGVNQQQAAEYRDRAKERRQAFALGKAAGAKPSAPKEEEVPPVQSTSKGASLLSKMGWSEGSGLGAQGTGVTAPISTELYAQGVGLGAKGGKIGDAAEEAGRKTRDRRDEFLEKTKETARQRFDQLNR